MESVIIQYVRVFHQRTDPSQCSCIIIGVSWVFVKHQFAFYLSIEPCIDFYEFNPKQNIQITGDHG